MRQEPETINITQEERKSMSHLDKELELLNDDILELMYKVKSQLEKCKKALIEFDLELAEDINVNEKRVDAMELNIDRECENILALFNPVAIDLRFVLAAIKINSDLERIGDHANSIAKYLMEFGESIDPKLVSEMEVDVMFDKAIKMLHHVSNAFIKEDTAEARKVFSMDKTLNKIHKESSAHIKKINEEKEVDMRVLLYLFSIISKLERVGDLTKNAAEEIVFFIEAKVLKHKKGQAGK
ncbi:phosphate signaling complex protein PhoU [Balneola sp. MJW-20]|uniref:phosphate signaling complex protein PhoU n=1 Tax=Gracilimonas aurantiaca TaxID=3234185 RepID=UPI003467ACD3